MTIRAIIAGASLVGLGAAVAPEAAAQEPFIGEVTIYPYNFCPRNWIPAEGQLLPISQYQALFSLYGTMYGGDGRTTFAVPDLRGRTVVGTGQGPGLTQRRHGEKFGTETVTLTVANMPLHTHVASVVTAEAAPDATAAAGNVPADFTGEEIDVYSSAPPSAAMAEGSVEVAPAGGSQPANVIQPSLALQYCVATQGMYPSRN